MCGRWLARQRHFSPSFLLAHTSPLVVPKYSPTWACASAAIAWRFTVYHAWLAGKPLSSRFQVLPALRVTYAAGLPPGLVRGQTPLPSIGNTQTVSGSRG